MPVFRKRGSGTIYCAYMRKVGCRESPVAAVGDRGHQEARSR